jgi:hypothetical protein
MTPSATGPVPAVIRGDETIVVDRAWPSVRVMPSGGLVIRFEGRDQDGRLRAGRLVVSRRPAASTYSAGVTAHGSDRKLPDLAGVVEDGELIVHRLGRRAVVRRPDRYVKVLRPGAAAETVADRSRVGARLVAAAGFATPSVLAAGDGRLDLSILPGIGLHESGRTMDIPTWRAAWDAWACAWTCLATHHGRTGASLPAHTADDELAGLRSSLGHVRTFTALPHLERDLVRRCAALAEDLAATRPDPLVVSHRDLHDKQILWDGNAIGLLDLDTLARAEAACDLANLAVHAELRTVQGLWSGTHRDIVLEHVADVARALGVSPRRLEAYAEATRLRLTMLYAFRPRWAPLMSHWLHERSLIAVSSS